MSGNPKASQWRSTPQTLRGRPVRTFTLPPAVDEAITALAEREGVARSRVVEEAIKVRAKAAGMPIPEEKEASTR